MKTVTFFMEGSEPFTREYIDAAGDTIIMLIDADEHIKKGGFVLIEANNVAQLVERPIFNREAAA